MIGRVYRGGDVGGLLRYLYGPGRHNEHEAPHLVAAWDLTTPAELASLEPPVLSGQGARAVRDFGPLTGSLELATGLRTIPESVAARLVWHCPLRVAPGDRELSDAEWGEVARDVVHRTGIAERGDDGGCRWVAVRHDAHSVHLVAVLARQDGRAARVSYDHLRVREACRAAEQRLGLTGTAPADRTAATHVTRAEVEKTVRRRGRGSGPGPRLAARTGSARRLVLRQRGAVRAAAGQPRGAGPGPPRPRRGADRLRRGPAAAAASTGFGVAGVLRWRQARSRPVAPSPAAALGSSRPESRRGSRRPDGRRCCRRRWTGP